MEGGLGARRAIFPVRIRGDARVGEALSARALRLNAKARQRARFGALARPDGPIRLTA